MQDNPIVIGFSSGELSPWLSSRIDLSQYNRGAALLENFFVEPYGGLRRRYGSRHIGQAADANDASRLHPFTFSSDENLMLEFYPSHLRFYKSGELLLDEDGEVYSIETPWDTAEKIHSLNFAQVNDVVFVVSEFTPPYELKRYDDLDWVCEMMLLDCQPRMEQLDQSGYIDVIFEEDPVNEAMVYSGEDGPVFESGMEGQEYLIAKCKVPAKSLCYKDACNVDYYPTYSNINRSITSGTEFKIYQSDVDEYRLYTAIEDWDATCLRASTEPEDYPHYFFCGAMIDLGEYNPYYASGAWELKTHDEWNASWELRRSYDDYSVNSNPLYWDWVTIHTFEQNDEDTRENFAFSGDEADPCYLCLVSVAMGNGHLGKDLPISWDAFQSERELSMKIVEVIDSTQARVEVEGALDLLPYAFTTRDWSFGAFGYLNGYPQYIAFHQGRLWLGGTNGQPTTIQASRVDDYYDFTIGADDDYALQLTLASDDQSRICWVSATSGLLVGTSEGEWMLNSSDGSGISASNATFTRQSSVGSDTKVARNVENSIFYVQRGGSRLREISYKLASDGYTSTDTSLLAEHLFAAGAKEWVVQRGGSTRIWVLMNDGSVAVLTTNIAQQVTAWQRVSFEGGEVLHIAALPSADNLEDELWLLIRRGEGDAQHTSIELVEESDIYLDNYHIVTVQDAALSLPSFASQDVTIYPVGDPDAAQAVHVPETGLLSLPDAEAGASYLAGKIIYSSMQTMPLELQQSFNAVSQLGRVSLRFYISEPHFFYKASHVDTWEEYTPEMDAKYYPWTGGVRVSHMPSPWVGQGFCLRCQSLRPMNLLALSVERDFHGK